ncbi:MAG: hypothetical protein WBM46_07560 [Polyangiales bacterium]|jgi:hypothetical protein
MKRTVSLIAALLMFGTTASAQDEAGAVAEPEATAEAPATAAPAPKEDKRGPYYKKVQGWLWLEGFAGPSSYDPDQFGSLSLSNVPNAPRVKGPEGGFAVGTPFGGPFFLGWFYRRANYGDYGLMKTGVEFQPTIRIPYVHVMFRVDLGFAKMVNGNPYGLTNLSNGGIVATGGVGIRIPIVRWISFVGSVDWSFVGLSLKGDDPNGNPFNSWILGRQVTGTFGLTFQFIGVRKN